jgi:hypothetical protein
MRRFALVSLCGACLLVSAAAAVTAQAPNTPKQDRQQYQQTDRSDSGRLQHQNAPRSSSKQNWSHRTGQSSAQPKANTSRDSRRERPCHADQSTQPQERALSGQQAKPNAGRRSDNTVATRVGWRGLHRLDPTQRQQVLQALMRLSETERWSLVEQLAKLRPQERQRLCYLFGLDQTETKEQANARRPRGRVLAVRRITPHARTTTQASGPAQFSSTQPARRGNRSMQRVSDLSPRRQYASQRYEQQEFLIYLANSLQRPGAVTMTVVNFARDHLTPRERVRLLEPVLEKQIGSRSLRDAAYVVLIESYHELGQTRRTLELAQEMAAEYGSFKH